MGFLGGSDSKESSCNTGDLGSIPGLGRSPGEGNSYPLQYTGLENSRDCIVHGVTKSQTWLSFTQMLFTHKQKIICGTIWRNVDGTASDSDTRDYLLYNNYFGNKYLNLRLPALFSSVQFSRSVHVWLFATLWTAARQASLSITNSRSSPKAMSIESVMPSSHLILCCPLFLLPPILPSIRVFSNESALCIRWPKYWSFSFNISHSSEHPGLISFRMDWLYLLALQGTLKSLLQHHSSKASILWHSDFFIVQLSYPYMTIGKAIDLTRWTFVDKVMSLLFNILYK